MAYQGVSDNCHDVGIIEIDLLEAQASLKSSIRCPEWGDWERQGKYFGDLPEDILQQTLKHFTQLGILLPSSHLQRQFKFLNLSLKKQS